MYIGTKAAGPILQYDADGSDKWDGANRRDFSRGAWTPIYSRGDYGKRYAFGGHWSGHNNNLLMSVGIDPLHKSEDQSSEVILLGGEIAVPPPGIARDATITDIDCSGSWAIWYPSASQAIEARLAPEQVQQASLPEKNKVHLGHNETQHVLDMVREVIAAHKFNGIYANHPNQTNGGK
jgi:hypothetical protein